MFNVEYPNLMQRLTFLYLCSVISAYKILSFIVMPAIQFFDWIRFEKRLSKFFEVCHFEKYNQC